VGVTKSEKGQGRSGDRVIRGGNWNNNARNCRSANRNRNNPNNRNNNIGFRVASTLEGRNPAVMGTGSVRRSAPRSPVRLRTRWKPVRRRKGPARGW